VPVSCFILFLCFRKVTQEIFLELDETKSEPPIIYRSFQKSEEKMEGGHEAHGGEDIHLATAIDP
jgi:hypothetical protein